MEAENNPSSPNAIPPAVSKRTKGRQKIEMKKIEKKSGLNVTFSKRRNGLFKKAEKLCNLFNTEMAILVLSKAGRPHNWGYPSLKSVIDRYMDAHVHHQVQDQEGGRDDDEPPQDRNRDDHHELQNSSMGSQSNLAEVVDPMTQILHVEKGTKPTCTQDFLAGFL